MYIFMCVHIKMSVCIHGVLDLPIASLAFPSVHLTHTFSWGICIAFWLSLMFVFCLSLKGGISWGTWFSLSCIWKRSYRLLFAILNLGSMYIGMSLDCFVYVALFPYCCRDLSLWPRAELEGIFRACKTLGGVLGQGVHEYEQPLKQERQEL